MHTTENPTTDRTVLAEFLLTGQNERGEPTTSAVFTVDRDGDLCHLDVAGTVPASFSKAFDAMACAHDLAGWS